MRRIKLYSNKIDNHYTHLVTGVKYYAPLGLFNTQTAWTVRRFLVEKNFPLDKYQEALDYLQEINRLNNAGDLDNQMGARHVTTEENKYRITGIKGINIRVENTIHNKKRLFVVYYSFLKKAGTYLAGSAIIIDNLSDYNISMHFKHIRKAERIRLMEKKKIERDKARRQRNLL